MNPTRTCRSFALLAILVLGLTACGDDPENNLPSNQDDEAVATFEGDESAENFKGFSPLSIFFSAIYSPVFEALGDELTEPKDCPVETVTDDESSFTGGCTDDDGNDWSGSYTATFGDHKSTFRIPGGSFNTEASSVVIDNFSVIKTTACDADPEIGAELTTTFHGNITIDAADAENATFAIDFQMSGTEFDDDCVVVDKAIHYLYEGSFEILEIDEQSGDATHHAWSGLGSIDYPHDEGRVDLRTPQQVFDLTACEHEPYSGSTFVTFENEEIEYRYNGETDCDEDATVSWFIDDEEQGQVTGVSCSTTSSTPATATLAIVLLLILRLQKRRPRSHRGTEKDVDENPTFPPPLLSF